MNYQNLKEFLAEKMRMSHIYQPVMLKRLLEGKGSATDKEIAQTLLNYDPSQLEYYQNITNKMVGKVLRSHNVVEKSRNTYTLIDYEDLTQNQIEELIHLCDNKIDFYIRKRGDAIWSHRRINRNAIPGTIRYEVFKRAKCRCELCGISGDERALEVDHILPVNQGGEDSINNYQALCYVCNATKRDRDSEDFRGNSKFFDYRDNSCVFCNIEKKRIISENHLAYALQDKFPVTKGHTLIIPKRHFPDYFSISQPEINSVNALLKEVQNEAKTSDSSISAFNIGINSGSAAGQTIFHTHIHLIPRRKGDVENPRGGIRNLIPGMGDYIS
jgi:ATP adenylyltransferase